MAIQMTVLSVIQNKQNAGIIDSKTIKIGLFGMIMVLITVIVVRLIPQLDRDADMIFSVGLSIFGAFMTKYMGTDLLSILAEIMQIVFRDKKVDAKDFSNILSELLLDDNGLTKDHVAAVEKKLIDRGVISASEDVEVKAEVSEGVG